MLVSTKFISDFDRSMKHIGCDEEEIRLMKEDIRNEKYPFQHYADWFAEYVRLHVDE